MKTKLSFIGYAFLVSSIILTSYLLTLLQQTNPTSSAPENPTTSKPSEHAGLGTKNSGLTATNSQKSRQVLASNPTPPTSQRVKNAATKIADKTISKNGVLYPLRIYKPTSIPNDTYANQWWVAPTAMSGAWDLPPGARATKIAVIDTGFALAHQDLTGRWATNSGESGSTAIENASAYNCTSRSLTINKSCNLIDDNFDGIIDNESGATTKQNPNQLNCTDQGISLNKSCNRNDDDGNGLIDDYRGWDFSNYDNSVQAGEVNSSGTGTTHGTMVSGVLGATANNGVGIAGVNWYSTILPIQALDDDSYGDSLTVSEGIHYAVDQHADVISISLSTAQDDPYIREAVRYATDHGSLVVAASGNDGCNCISYPANYPEVIAVGALDHTNNPASFSNYGRNLDVVAPGEGMTSAYWTPSNPTSSYASNIAGTSFATPFMSALFGLGRSYQPNATWDEIVGAMLENGDRRTLSASSPRSDTIGFGYAQAQSMLTRLRTVSAPTQRYQFGSVAVQGSTNIYQCADTIPATLIYSLTKPNLRKYATGTLGYYNLSAQGWSQQELMYACIGLPTDTPSIVRGIDLNREIFNLTLKP